KLPDLSELRIFGLSWPPPPPPPPPPAPPAAREPKRQPASATTADGGEVEGLSGDGGESVMGARTGESKARGLARRLSAWRRGRPKTDGGVGRSAAAVHSASEEGQDRPIAKAGRWRKVGALAGLRKRLPLYGSRGGARATSGQGDFEATSPVTAGALASGGGGGGGGGGWWFARNGAGGGEPQPKKGRGGGDGKNEGGGGGTRSMLRKGTSPSAGLSAPAKLEPAVTPGKSPSKTSTQQQRRDRPGQALVDRRDSSPKALSSPSSPPPPPGGDKDKGKKQVGSNFHGKRKSAGSAGTPTSSKGQVAGRTDADEPLRGGGGGRTVVPEADETSSKGERSVDTDGKPTAAATAPTHFIPKFAPPPNAWKILSSKSPVEEPKASDQSGDRSREGSPAPSSSPSVPGGSGGAVGQDKWEGGPSKGSAADVDDDGGEEHDEFRDFGDVPLSVTRISKPPNMDITINRSSGTPANAETRPAAAAAAKAAADSDNVLEEWVDGEPVQVHHGRMTSGWKPTRPDGLSGTSGEMKLVEMACLTGLSSRAGKSAGRIMLEEV
ncbi:unnamed protein product, partial [Ectocarpus fasciculatus]